MSKHRSDYQGLLEGKIALITGAASGIGRATALGFAREGATVVVCDANATGGQETVDLIKKTSGQAVFVRADVAKAADVNNMVDTAVRTFGRLDCAFNNAGITDSRVNTIDMKEEDWDRVMSVNLKGVWLCLKYEIPQMLKQGGGAIVNTASILGLVALPGRPAYVASKHAVAGLTKAAALEYAKDKIRINALCPGTTATPLIEAIAAKDPTWKQSQDNKFPIGRFATPDEQAEAVIWLCSDRASYVTGHMMVVDGGCLAE